MYARLDNGWIKPEFIIGVEQFVEFAKMHSECMDGSVYVIIESVKIGFI